MRPLAPAIPALLLVLASSFFPLRAQDCAEPGRPVTAEELAARKEKRVTEYRDALRKKSHWVELSGLNRAALQEGSDQGMSWSDLDVLYLGPFIDQASAAIRELHEKNPSHSTSVGGGGTSANVEEFLRAISFTDGEDGRFARGCKAHQRDAFIAVKGLAFAHDKNSPLEARLLRVQRKGFTHNAVIVFPKGKDWKKNGVVLDGWVRQSHLPNEMTFLFRDWYGKADFAARLLSDDDY